MKKFLLALLAFAEELDIVEDDGVDVPEAVLEAGEVRFFFTAAPVWVKPTFCTPSAAKPSGNPIRR